MSTFKRFLHISVGLVIFSFGSLGFADTLYVGSGQTYSTIQAAINAAVDGDTIIVMDGTYTGSGNYNIDFLGKAIRLQSQNGPQNCIIDCGKIEGTRGFYFHSAEDSSSVIEGLTITRGYVSDYGAGIYCDGASPTIVNCVISDNQTTASGDSPPKYGGGGIYCNGASPTIINCVISNNQSTASGFSSNGYGGGLYNLNSSPTVSHCIFSMNSATINGGGMYNENSNPSVTDCSFNGNTANNSGGGMCNKNSSPTVTYCTFVDNKALSAGEGGGGMANVNSSPNIIGCVFQCNTIAMEGGGMRNSGGGFPILVECTFNENIAYVGGGLVDFSNATIMNCLFTDNTADYAGGLLVNENPAITNCIVWGNSGNQIESYGSPVVTYSDVQGGFAGIGNLNLDPLFADPATDDYHLKSQAGRWNPISQQWVQDTVTSPCIDAGDPADTGWTSELWPNGRRINMGAFGGTPQASMSPNAIGLAADQNFDDAVDVLDLLLFAQAWTRHEVLLAADLTRDGRVGIEDLAVMAENWMK